MFDKRGPAKQPEIGRYVWGGWRRHTNTHLCTACWDRERNARRCVTPAAFGLLNVILAQFRSSP